MPNPSKGEREAFIIRVPVATLERLRKATERGGRNEFIILSIEHALTECGFPPVQETDHG